MKKRWIALGGIISLSIPATVFVVLSMKNNKTSTNREGYLENNNNKNQEKMPEKINANVKPKDVDNAHIQTIGNNEVKVENILITKQEIVDDFATRKVDLTPMNISDDNLQILAENDLKAKIIKLEPLGEDDRTAEKVTISLYSIYDEVKPREYTVIITGFADPKVVEAQDAINNAVSNNKIKPIIKEGRKKKVPSSVTKDDFLFNASKEEQIITRTIVDVTSSDKEKSTSVIVTIEVDAKDKELKDIKAKTYKVEINGFTNPKVIQIRKHLEWIKQHGMPPIVKAGSRHKTPNQLTISDFNLDLITDENTLFYNESIEKNDFINFNNSLTENNNVFGKFALAVIKTLNNLKEQGLPGIFINITSDGQPLYKIAIDFSDLIYQNNNINALSWIKSDISEKTYNIDDFNKFLSNYKLKIKDNKLFINDNAWLTDNDYKNIGYLLYEISWAYVSNRV